VPQTQSVLFLNYKFWQLLAVQLTRLQSNTLTEKKLRLSSSLKLRVFWRKLLCYKSGREVCSWHNHFSTIITVIPGFHYKFVMTGRRIKNTTWRIKYQEARKTAKERVISEISAITVTVSFNTT